MSPAHFWLGASAEKSRFSRFGAILKLWLLSVVALNFLFRRLKGYHRIFSRFEKLDVMYRAFLNLALIVNMIKC